MKLDCLFVLTLCTLLLFVRGQSVRYGAVTKKSRTDDTTGSSTKNSCGNPTDDCMNEDSWNQCHQLKEQDGCFNIKTVSGSCPKKFVCDDPIPDACVGLKVYDNKKCHGDPVRTMQFDTFTEPGSPCYHDATMPGYSVKDQYCTLSTGNWHQTIYVGNEKCHVSWYQKFYSPWNLTYTQDSCVEGFSLAYCYKGSCTSAASTTAVSPVETTFFDEQHQQHDQDQQNGRNSYDTAKKAAPSYSATTTGKTNDIMMLVKE